MNKIIITVEGSTGAGKSTIAQQIATQLVAIGVDTELNFINNEHPLRTPENHLMALTSLKEHGIKVIINEKQASRK